MSDPVRTVTEKWMDTIAIELMHGLTTDGGHHKQHHLEAALRILCGDEWVDKAHHEWKWKKGIPS